MSTTWLSNGQQTGGSGSYVAGTQSLQYIHDNFAANGDTIQIPDGSYSWNTTNPVNITKAVAVQAQNMPADARVGPSAVNITHAGGTGTYLISIAVASGGNSSLGGVNFLPGTGTATQYYLSVGGGPIDKGGPFVVLLTNCTFSVPHFQLLAAVAWFAGGGVIWRNHFFGSTPNSGSGNGSGSGCLQIKGTIKWWVLDTFGTNDTTGTGNLYIEDNLFDNFFNQGIDCDDNTRVVIRHNVLNNTQCLTHGPTSLEGGRAVEFYNNTLSFFPTNTTFVNGQFQAVTASGQTPNNGGSWPNMSRWFWFRAGTARLHDNTIQAINSFGYYGAALAWIFINESLTRNGPNAPCQLDSAYPGWHWCGNGGNVPSANAGGAYSSSGTGYTAYQISDPVYIWNNTYTFNPQSGTAGMVLPDASQWGTNDQTGANATCGQPVAGTNQTSDVFLLNRDIYLSAPPSGAGGVAGPYATYTYPHPLVAGGGGGGGGTGGGGGGGGGGAGGGGGQAAGSTIGNPPFMPISFVPSPPAPAKVWEDGPGFYADKTGTKVIYNGQTQTALINKATPKPPRNFSPAAAPPSMSKIV